MNNIAIVIYSHNEYSDLWIPAFTRLKQYLGLNKLFLITNSADENLLKKFGITPIYYDDNLVYNKRLVTSLVKIPENIILFLHEDMILYDNVDANLIQELSNKLNDKYKFIRLIKSGINTNVQAFQDLDLYDILDNDINFSITPTIWDKNTLIKISNETPPLGIWDFETYGNIFIKKNFIKGLYYHKSTNMLRGKHHYDSSIFPHMCSAIFKGKWNMEYRSELNLLFKEFSIDKNIRGTIF